MKRITLGDFIWQSEPAQEERTYRQINGVIGPDQQLPNAPLLLAVSDEYFSFSATLTLAPEGGCSGLCIYHLDSTFIAVGLSSSAVLITTAISGWQNTCAVPFPVEGSVCHWSMVRSEQGVAIGYRFEEEEHVRWIGTFTLPGIAHSLSFGPFFTNQRSTPYSFKLSNVRYTRQP
jgi:hypothetical protein